MMNLKKIKNLFQNNMGAPTKASGGFSLVELAIVAGLISITTLAAVRLASFLQQSNNGLTFRMQRIELQRNLRHIFFNGDHCACTFNGIIIPTADIDVTARAFLIREDPLRCGSAPVRDMLPTLPVPRGISATSIRLTNVTLLGDPPTARRAMARLEYTITSPKEILGPRTYTDSLLFAMNLQDAGGGRLSVASCGKAPSEVETLPGARAIRLSNNTPGPVAQGTGVLDSGLYLAQLDIKNGNNPFIDFFAPNPINPAQPTIIDRYHFSTGTDGRIQTKSLLILIPLFNGQIMYHQRSGDARNELTPLARVVPPYSPLTPLVQFASIKKLTNPLVLGRNSGNYDIPVTLSQPNNVSDVQVQYTVIPKSAHMRTNAIPGVDYNLPPPPNILTFPAGSNVLSQNIPLDIRGAGTGQMKTIILRINVIDGGVINYPNEHIVRFQD